MNIIFEEVTNFIFSAFTEPPQNCTPPALETGSDSDERVAGAVSYSLDLLSKLPWELSASIAGYLKLSDMQEFINAHQDEAVREKLKKVYWTRIALPQEAWGDLDVCCRIVPMPQPLLDILHGEDGSFYRPILRATHFFTRECT